MKPDLVILFSPMFTLLHPGWSQQSTWWNEANKIWRLCRQTKTKTKIDYRKNQNTLKHHCNMFWRIWRAKVMKVHGGKDFAKLQKAFIILSQTFWLTLLYRRVDVSVARCGFHEIGKKTLDSSYSEILRTIDVLQKEKSNRYSILVIQFHLFLNLIKE